MFYAMGHFSKFLDRGAARLLTSVEGENANFVRAVAFHSPTEDHTDIVIVLNTYVHPLFTNHFFD